MNYAVCVIDQFIPSISVRVLRLQDGQLRACLRHPDRRSSCEPAEQIYNEPQTFDSYRCRTIK